MAETKIVSQVAVVPATKDTSIAQWGQVKEYVDKRVKETVRVATTGEITGTYSDGVFTPDSPVTTIDGITLAENDRILVKDQADATQNGIYVVDATGATLTRSDDFKASSIIMNNTTIPVAEGTTNVDTKWVVVSDGVLTVDTSSILFVKDVGDSGFKNAHGTFTGDGTTTEFDVMHNFNLTDTKAYQITVRDNAKNDIIVAHKPKTGSEANAITLTFDVAPLVTETFYVYLICLE